MRKASAAALLVAASIILTVCLAPVGCESNVGEKASGTTSSSAKSSASFAPPDGWVVLHGPAKAAFGQPGGAEQWLVVNELTGKNIPVEVLNPTGIITDLTQ